ncbi:MAG: hypothetical protein ABI193_03780 [Minicystis sp.]
MDPKIEAEEALRRSLRAELSRAQDDAPALDFVAWARLSGKVTGLALVDRAAVFAEAKIDAGTFRAADRHWTPALSRDREKLKRYGAICAEERARRAEDAAKAEREAERAAEVEEKALRSARESAATLSDAAALAATVPALAAAPVAPAPEPAAKPPRGALRNFGTVDVSAALAEAGISRPLPFAGPKPGSPALPASRVVPSSPAPPARSSGLRGTVKLDDALAAANAKSPLPFAVAAPTPGAALTLEQYASLCAESAVASPQAAPQIGKRYGLADERALAALHEDYRARFARDPALDQRFRALEAQYRAWLSQQAR